MKEKTVFRGFGCLALAVCMAVCCGCASTELEQRSFPLAVGIDTQEDGETMAVSFDFPDLAQISEKGKTGDTPVSLSLEGEDMYHVEKSYENNTNRLLDYNHMKAVVLGEPFLSQSEMLRRLLLAWEQQEASVRNTSLFVGDASAAEILSLTEETEGSVGKYLEEMIESQKDFKQEKTVTMGDLMNQWHNQDELLLIPILTEQGQRPAITSYAAVLDFEYLGNVSVEEAMEAFLSQGLLERFTCEAIKQRVVEISGIQVTHTVSQAGDVPLVTVSVKGKGRLISGQASSAAEMKQIKERIERQLTTDLMETAQKFRQEYGIDMTNSYLSLGGHDRELYRSYQNMPELYNSEAQQVFQVEVSMMHWE